MANYEVEERELIPGVIGLGRFADKRWSEVREDYLEYLVSDEYLTNSINKEKAKKELRNRMVQPGQMKFL